MGHEGFVSLDEGMKDWEMSSSLSVHSVDCKCRGPWWKKCIFGEIQGLALPSWCLALHLWVFFFPETGIPNPGRH